jgi:formylglycine-generating enzyme required for sulfatase activity
MRFLLATAVMIGLFACAVLKKKQPPAPPGTVHLKDNLYIDRTEIGNIHWREFVFWLDGIDKDSIKSSEMLPDTLAWANSSPRYGAFMYSEYYFRHPMYNYYPVVGISYDQAVAFCKWRSMAVNKLYEANPFENPFPGKKYLYRLPTKEEWEFAASGQLDTALYPYGLLTVMKTRGRWKGARLLNYENKSDSSKYYTPTVPIKAYQPNAYKIYNMAGNVSEIIAEKGIAKGGNFMLPLEQLKITGQQSYTKPEAWLGFRCVCEVVD